MIGINADDFRGDDLADPHFLAREAFLEQRGKTFTRASGGDRIHCLHIKDLEKPVISTGSG
jgi:hypothetical protein